MSSMSRPVRKSVATDQNGTSDPDRILPIANTNINEEVQQVGFMFRGNEYGDGTSWIVCDRNDLEEIER